MKNIRKKNLADKGITLVALVITIVILLILAGITIATLGGENGLFARAKQAKEKTQREAATEKINLVISNVYVKNYSEKLEDPTLQDLADGFCNDEDTEYVDTVARSTSALEPIEIGESQAIYVKLKQYPYEFEIDNNLKIASIDGIDVSEITGDTSEGEAGSSGDSNEMSSEMYEEMQSTIAQLQQEVLELKTSKTLMEQEMDDFKSELTGANDKISSTQNQIDNMLTTLDVDTRTTLFKGTAGTATTSYTISDISEYKYIIVYTCFTNNVNLFKNSMIINVSDIDYSSNDVYCISDLGSTSSYYVLAFRFKSSTQLYIATANATGSWSSPRVYKIEGIK